MCSHDHYAGTHHIVPYPDSASLFQFTSYVSEKGERENLKRTGLHVPLCEHPTLITDALVVIPAECFIPFFLQDEEELSVDFKLPLLPLYFPSSAVKELRFLRIAFVCADSESVVAMVLLSLLESLQVLLALLASSHDDDVGIQTSMDLFVCDFVPLHAFELLKLLGFPASAVRTLLSTSQLQAVELELLLLSRCLGNWSRSNWTCVTSISLLKGPFAGLVPALPLTQSLDDDDLLRTCMLPLLDLLTHF